MVVIVVAREKEKRKDDCWAVTSSAFLVERKGWHRIQIMAEKSIKCARSLKRQSTFTTRDV